MLYLMLKNNKLDGKSTFLSRLEEKWVGRLQTQQSNVQVTLLNNVQLRVL